MNNNNAEYIFKELAARYVEHEGAQLKAELAADTAAGVVSFTPRLDRKVKSRRHGTRRIAFSGLAAAVALFVAIFALQTIKPMEKKNDSVNTESGSGMIPLSFTLPETMSVATRELDRGDSVYTLDNTGGDDVVMVLSHKPADTSELTPTNINGHAASEKSTEDYHLLIFEKDGIYYRLSCRYNMKTLISLSKNIL